jgi:hypothetical protein
LAEGLTLGFGLQLEGHQNSITKTDASQAIQSSEMIDSTKQRKALFLGYVLGCASIFALMQFGTFRKEALDSVHATSIAKPNATSNTLLNTAATNAPGNTMLNTATTNTTGNTTGNTNTTKRVRWDHTFMRDHPHAGARDENGTWPYIPDVEEIRRTALQRIQNDPDYSANPNHYLPFHSNLSVCQQAPGEGFEGPHGYKALREYVELDGPDPLPEEHAPVKEEWWASRDGHLKRHRGRPQPFPPPHRTAVPPPRILCGVYTYEPSHGNIADIVDTWGWRCDGFYAASTKTNRSIGAVELPHQGEEFYGNMWQKTRSMVAFMYDYYLDDYDYFLLCGDDTFIILENLRNYLLLLESETGGRHAQPLYMGMAFSLWGVHYNTGGPGYLLSRSALQRLVEDGLDYFYTDTVISGEDAVMGGLMTVLHVHLVDTTDAANRQRFFHDSLDEVASDSYLHLYPSLTYDHGHRTGRNIISTQSIGFHLIKSMHRFAAIVYNACPIGTVLGDAQGSTVPALT